MREPIGEHRGGAATAPTLARDAALVLGVAAAYYLGARIGFVLRFPPATTSVLWPPNALLTAALLLAPRRFWLVLLAALPAHVLVEMQAGFSPLLIASLFLTNCLEALVAAAAVRHWSDDATRFDSLQRVLAFVGGAVILAPVVSGFADAAIIHEFRGESYGLVVVRRLFSNALSQLAIVPSAILIVRDGRSWLRRATRQRFTEFGLLAIGLVALASVVFHAYHHRPLVLLGGPVTALAFLLPPLLLYAVRFGPPGASLSLLATALLATGIAVSGPELPTALPADERVRVLQVFLLAVGVPLLFLGALVEERRQAAETMQERLRFESMVSEVSGTFVHPASHEVADAFAMGLERLAQFFALDRAVLWEFSGEQGTMVSVEWWARPEAGPPPATLEAPEVGQLIEALLRREPFLCANARALPEASPMRHLLERWGVRSVLAVPLVVGDQVVGTLGLTTVREARNWPAWGIRGARLLADVFASALARQRAEDALRASEAMKSAVLASLTNRVAVLDREGRIIAVNESWSRFGGAQGTDGCDAGVGANYLDVCLRAGDGGVRDAHVRAAGIRDVLDGRRPSFGHDCVPTPPSGDGWFHLTTVPLNRPEGGAVVSYADVTERRLAESMAQRSRDELAHYLRVYTIGELTTSLAHELNQPLAAILFNAQAAQRILDRPPADGARPEVDEILGEIISEGRRAGEVIRRLRLLLRKGVSEHSGLDVNVLVDEVSRLLANDVMLRGVTLRQDLALQPLPTRGDRVQLQQVLLNLLINALEAMSGTAGERVVVVRTEVSVPGMARVSVADTGPGLRKGTEDEVFKPFYSTKTQGMGMGLSIARSILEAHGGTIAVDGASHGGATFTFTLPLAEASPGR